MPNYTTMIRDKYNEIKAKYPDALLLFRMGDFYECYYEDAETVSLTLAITVSMKAVKEEPVYMTAFPHNALDAYLPRLIRAGYRVAICDYITK